jgi:hypothetical protein
MASMVFGCSSSLVLHLGTISLLAAAARPPVRLAARMDEAPPSVVMVDLAEDVAPLPGPPAPAAAHSAAHRAARRPRMVVSAPVTPPAPDLPPPAAPPIPPLPAVQASAPLTTAPSPPAQISASLARDLRVYDDFPSIPDRERSPRGGQTTLLRVCVSEQGTVAGVTVSRGGSGRIGDLLRAAIQKWRYHALVVDGTARPFCHLIQIEYQGPFSL